jgi:hypothetical protein
MRRAPCPASRERAFVRGLQVLALTSTILLGLAPLQAATVAIARPLHRSVGLTETLFRLYGELLSAGLDVTIADLPTAAGRSGPTDGPARLQEMASKRGVDAIIEIVGDEVPVAVDIHVIGNGTRAPQDTRVVLEPGTENASGRLAIRALEVLRSSFVEIDLGGRSRAGDSATKAITAPSTTVGQVEEPVKSPARFGIAAGAAVLTGLDGVGPAVLPLLRLVGATTGRLALQATLAGLGSRATVATAAGSARVAQQYGVVGWGYRLGASVSLRPFVALSAGVVRTSVDGQALAPRQGHDEVRWSFLAEGSLGAIVPLGARYYAAVAAHAQVAAPYVTIHFEDAVVATVGRPNLLLTFALGAWL